MVDAIETLKEKVRVKLKDGDGFFYKKYDAKDIKVIKDVVNFKKALEKKTDKEIKVFINQNLIPQLSSLTHPPLQYIN